MRGPLVSIDTAALRQNVQVLRAAVAPAKVMTVVKANAYGHGAVACALAFEDAGVDWLGVVDLDEATALRAGGVKLPILAWLHAPGETFERAVQHDITPGISDLAQLEACVAAGVPRVHLCLDTGLSRNGAVESEWPALFDRAAELRDRITVEGVMSHLSNTSPQEDGHQMASFVTAAGMLGERGITPPLQHLAASAASVSYGASRITMVRIGLASYGLSPFADRSPGDLGLRSALTLSAPVIGIKEVAAGEGTSYGYTWRAERDTRLALLPLGYADGIERHAGNRAFALIGGELRPVVGRIAMNSMTVDIGPEPTDAGAAVHLGDEAILFGDATVGHPTAFDWAESTGTINYEVVARLSPRLPRSYR
ncbi:alanine racemase [Frondihabitans sp. 4ASC-45]|uniref:alanine racemase n=1 Tax=Frondihabitans sp. 4ASC-45 TaxID=3111636 RepID=UPI003C18D0B9